MFLIYDNLFNCIFHVSALFRLGRQYLKNALFFRFGASKIFELIHINVFLHHVLKKYFTVN